MPGAHGSLTITPDGAWTYELDSGLPEVQGLGEGEFLTDTVTVTSLDGTEQSIEITITGTNDVPVISGELSGSVVEDEVLTASGQLSIADADAGESFFNEATVPGAHGSLTIDASGAWTYELDSGLPEVQGLGEGEFLTDTVTVTSLDGTEQSIEITITGTNDVPVISGELFGSVIEDEVLTASGQLDIADPMLVRRSSMSDGAGRAWLTDDYAGWCVDV